MITAKRDGVDSFGATKIRDLIRYEDKHSPNPNVCKKQTGRQYDAEFANPDEMIVQIENSVDAIRVLKELDTSELLVSHQTNNIPQLLRQLKACRPDVEVLSPSSFRYQLKLELQTYLDETKKKTHFLIQYIVNLDVD